MWPHSVVVGSNVQHTYRTTPGSADLSCIVDSWDKSRAAGCPHSLWLSLTSAVQHLSQPSRATLKRGQNGWGSEPRELRRHPRLSCSLIPRVRAPSAE